MAHQYMPKIFHNAHKHCPPSPPSPILPTCLMYGPSYGIRRFHVTLNENFLLNISMFRNIPSLLRIHPRWWLQLVMMQKISNHPKAVCSQLYIQCLFGFLFFFGLDFIKIELEENVHGFREQCYGFCVNLLVLLSE